MPTAIDLRIPDNYAELLDRIDLTPEMQTSFVSIVQQETERVSNMATRFLDLARLESGRVQMDRHLIDIVEIVERAIEIIQPLALE